MKTPRSSSIPTTGTNHPTLASYPKGVWTSYGGKHVPQEIINNKGIVGLNISISWSLVETADGVYDFSALDEKLTNAKSSGFKYFNLTVINSSWDTPAWLTQELKDLGETIPLLDLGASHSTYCQVMDVPLYWSERWHAKRLALVAAFGAKYSTDPSIIAVPTSFANQNSMDWNIQDKIGFFCDQNVDQVQQWLDAGWTREKMLQVGKEMCDAVSVAFPNQNIKLPIGGTAQPLCGDGVYSTLAIEITDYVKTRPYANRFFVQRNTVNAKWALADDLIQHPPQPSSDRYIRKMILDASPLSGLQTVDYASRCLPGETCRQNGDQICENAVQVMEDSLNVMMSFNPTYIEVWGQDAKNRDFYTMIKSATTAIGGQIRQ